MVTTLYNALKKIVFPSIYCVHFLFTGIMIIVGLKLISAVFLVTAIVLFISYYSTFKEGNTFIRMYAVCFLLITAN